MSATVDTQELETKVKDMYRHVAQQPDDRFHFELGAPVALRVGYDADRLAPVPGGAVESFAGVSGTSSTWPTSSRERVSSTSGAARAWTPSTPPAWSARRVTCTGSTSPRSS